MSEVGSERTEYEGTTSYGLIGPSVDVRKTFRKTLEGQYHSGSLGTVRYKEVLVALKVNFFPGL